MHHGVVRFWRHLYKEHARAHTHTHKSTSSSEQQSPAIAAFTTTRNHTRNPFRELQERVLHTLFFPTGPPRDHRELRNDRPPPDARGQAVSSARSWRRGPRRSATLCTTFATHRLVAGPQAGCLRCGVCWEASQPVVCDGREMLLFVVMALISHLMSCGRWLMSKRASMTASRHSVFRVGAKSRTCRSE